MTVNQSFPLPAPLICIVLPCYNEQEIITDTLKRLGSLLENLVQKDKISKESFLVFVDDGSRDSTWELIEEARAGIPHVRGLKLSKNYGHQNAIMAGMFNYKDESDCIITIDADLQDDETAMEQMIDKYREGYQIIYGVRKARNTDSFFKKYTAIGFYILIKKLGVNIIYNHADYRLASRRVVQELKKYREVNLFLRGIFPLLGYKHTMVYYDRKERTAGETKFPFKKMLAFAIQGITSFSVKPLRVITIIGFLIFILSILLSGYVIFSWLFLNVVPGWSSIALPMYFIGGVQLLSIGIIGEYLGKIYQEVKQRPRYNIDKKI